jgi:murein peptide amidase A
VSRRALALCAVIGALVAVTVTGVFAATSPRHPVPRPSRSDATRVRATPATWVVIGHSRQGRRIVAAQFGSGPRRLLVVGGVHGREYGRRVAERLAAYLVAHPGAIPPGSRVDVLPCLNPDGAALRRRGNARNVDLNRNFPTADWTRALRSGDPAATACNGGTGPASEPETRALLRYLGQGFDCVISLHSKGGFIDFNGLHARRIAAVMSRASGLPVERIAYQGSITGSLGEYGPAAYHMPVITVELSRPRLTNGLISAVLRASALSGSLAARHP